MAATVYNFTLNPGETFSLPLLFKDSTGTAISLTTATVAAQIRDTPGSQNIIAAITCTKDAVTAGKVVLSLTSTQTAQLVFPSLTAAYDVLVTFADGTKLRAMQGTVTFSGQVTR